MAITVTSAAASTDLTTTAKVKDDLGITVSTYDTLIARFIARASAVVTSYCGRQFAQQRITETLASDGSDTIILSRHPVTTLHSVTYDGVTVTASDYFLDSPEAGIIRHDTSWNYTSRELLYSVDCTYGYVLESFGAGTPDLPADIEQACIEIVKAFYYSRQRDSSITSEAVPQVYTVRYGNASGAGGTMGIPAMAASLLEPYRERRV